MEIPAVALLWRRSGCDGDFASDDLNASVRVRRGSSVACLPVTVGATGTPLLKPRRTDWPRDGSRYQEDQRFFALVDLRDGLRILRACQMPYRTRDAQATRSCGATIGGFGPLASRSGYIQRRRSVAVQLAASSQCDRVTQHVLTFEETVEMQAKSETKLLAANGSLDWSSKFGKERKFPCPARLLVSSHQIKSLR